MNTVAESIQSPPAAATERSRRLWQAMWLVWIVGVVVNLVLIWQGWHAGGAQAATGGLLGCGPGEGCGTIFRSSYARILGYPLTYWGLSFYILLALAMLASIFAWQLSLASPLSLVLPVVAWVGVVAGGWSVGVMWVLKSYCLWCLGLHAVNLLYFGLSVAYARQEWQSRQAARAAAGVPPLPLTPITLIVVLAILLGGNQVLWMNLFHSSLRSVRPMVPFPEPALGLKPVPTAMLATLAVDAPTISGTGAPRKQILWTVKGPRDAPHRIVVFSCLTCPVCRSVNEALVAIAARHPGELRIDERFYPLSHACNDRVPPGPIDAAQTNACPLARLAVAVALAKPDEFDGFLDWVYDHQLTVTESLARGEAEKRTEKATLLAALDNDTVWERLREDINLGRQMNVEQVPQVFLEGGQVYGEFDAAILEQVLSEAYHWPIQPLAGGSDQDPVLIAANVMQARVDHAAVLTGRGHYGEAVRELKQTTRLKKKWPEVAIRLSWLLSTCPDGSVRNGADALYYARLAEQSADQELPQVHDVLAAALAELGRFDEARDEGRKAMVLYRQAGKDQQANEAGERFREYRRGQPHRMP